MMKRSGAVAVKFEAAYLRSLQFDNPPRSEAERVFNNYRHTAPASADYKILQDYLFRYIAAESGRLGMAVHLHVAAGAGGYFSAYWANAGGKHCGNAASASYQGRQASAHRSYGRAAFFHTGGRPYR